jgi:hypothetical protein
MSETIAIKAIITGATGMVGEGVLHECLKNPLVESILIINRKPSGVWHPKLKEIIHADFFNLTPIAHELKGYNACYFCLGVSSVGISIDEFYKMTYTLTMHFAETLLAQSPKLTFCYVSGSGTDSSEQGFWKWARVKGKTENDLMKLPFKKVYAFRPGYMHPTPGLHNTQKYYRYLSGLYPAFRSLFPSYVSSLTQLGLAMINTVNKGPQKNILEVKDINALAAL